MRLIILAAGQGLQLDGLNKLLLRDPADNLPLIEKYIKYFKSLDITIVAGFKAVNIMQNYPDLNYIYNSDWKLTNNSYSLSLALDETPCIVMSSDLFFDKDVADLIISGPENCVLTENRENRILTALNCSLTNNIVTDIYQGDIRDPNEPEAIGIYKISDPKILRLWKRKCREHGNLFVGQNLPLHEGCEIQSLDKGQFRFDEVNSPTDYLRVLESHRESSCR
ncbi:NTP transferase domain-containing protein [Gammaproteobacteria bacterium]|nr:NTP transferase domain-containing protein [Gammaproteobacteria bacterium]